MIDIINDSLDELREDEIDLDVPDGNGNFLIMSPIDDNDIDHLKLLIAQGINVNIDTGEGWTPLHDLFESVIDGMIQDDDDRPHPVQIKMIKVLLDNGANPLIKNKSGKTPLDFLVTYSSNEQRFINKDII